jgi:hypothetical protein
LPDDAQATSPIAQIAPATTMTLFIALLPHYLRISLA